MIDYKNIADAVSKYSPLVASGVTEFSPILGTVLMALTRAFNSDIPSLPSKIAADSDAETKIKGIEAYHYDELFKNQVADMQDARDREIKVMQLTGKRDRVLDSIAFLVIFGFFVMCATVEFTRMDASDHDVLYMLAGQLTAGFMMVLSYYFGSSNKQ